MVARQDWWFRGGGRSRVTGLPAVPRQR